MRDRWRARIISLGRAKPAEEHACNTAEHDKLIARLTDRAPTPTVPTLQGWKSHGNVGTRSRIRGALIVGLHLELLIVSYPLFQRRLVHPSEDLDLQRIRRGQTGGNLHRREKTGESRRRSTCPSL